MPTRSPAIQPATGYTVDAGDDRFSASVRQLGGYIFMANTITNLTRDAVHWMVLSETNNTLLGEGIISDGTHDFFYPSIAANHSGKILIAFNRSGSTSPDGDISVYAAVGTYSSTGVTMGSPFLVRQGTVSNYHSLVTRLLIGGATIAQPGWIRPMTTSSGRFKRSRLVHHVGNADHLDFGGHQPSEPDDHALRLKYSAELAGQHRSSFRPQVCDQLVARGHLEPRRRYAGHRHQPERRLSPAPPGTEVLPLAEIAPSSGSNRWLVPEPRRKLRAKPRLAQSPALSKELEFPLPVTHPELDCSFGKDSLALLADLRLRRRLPGRTNLCAGTSPLEFHIPEADAADRLVDLTREHGQYLVSRGTHHDLTAIILLV